MGGTSNLKTNYSVEHQKFLKSINRKKRIVLLWQLGILLSILALWEIFTQIGILNVMIFSSPSRIVSTISTLYTSGDLFYHIRVTLVETLVGFIIGVGLGVSVAILLWWSETLRKILDPYIVVLNSLPKIALGPIIIIWFGAGMQSIVVMCVLITIVITTLTMLNAFRSVSEQKILLMRSLGASKFTILSKLILPASLPQFVSVLKIAVGMSWVGSIMGEYLISSAGLGYLIVYGSQVFQLDLVMSSTILLCILASAMYLLVAMLEKLVHRHRGL
jgi:NitT/TauT family transport system permease protein